MPTVLSPGSLTFEAKDTLATQRWLKKLGIADQRVIVVWDEVIAISLPWTVFCDYWDDFCYPSSDDVDVLLEKERVFLRWHHYEVFEYDPTVS